MDPFARCVASWKLRVEANVKASGPLVGDPLVAFMHDRLEPNIATTLKGAPPVVIAAIQEAFSAHGWDWAANARAGDFTTDGLVAALATLSARFPPAAAAPKAVAAAASPKPVPEPSAAELASLSLACTKLWELDENRLTPGEGEGGM